MSTTLVNNASTFDYDNIRSATRKSWDRNLGSNLRAPFVLIQHFAAQVPPALRGPEGALERGELGEDLGLDRRALQPSRVGGAHQRAERADQEARAHLDEAHHRGGGAGMA